MQRSLAGEVSHLGIRVFLQEVYVPTESTRRRRGALHPRRYPKPLVFHDGRTAFRPTPAATLAMFLWLPLGAPLAVLRTAVFLLLPFSLSVPLLAALGMHNRMIASSSPKDAGDRSNLFACNHRSLLDPLCVSAAAGRRDLAAATYSISRLSEMLAPIPTFRLTRDRAADRAAMQAQLAAGGVPGGDDVQGAVPAAVQPAVRGAGGRRRGRGAGGAAPGGGHVPRHDGGGQEDAGPAVPADEPRAVLPGAVPRPRGVRRPGGARRGKRGAAAGGGGARVRAHGADEEGQVPDPRRQRRGRRRRRRHEELAAADASAVYY